MDTMIGTGNGAAPGPAGAGALVKNELAPVEIRVR